MVITEELLKKVLEMYTAEVHRLQSDNNKLLHVAKAGKRMLNELINSIPSGMTAMELSFTLEAVKDLLGED
jgi:hypothetical protein